MPFTYVIDTPSPFAPLPEWRRFLDGLERLPQNDDGVRFALASARRRIAEFDIEVSDVKSKKADLTSWN